RGQDFLRKAGYNIIATATRLDWKPHIFDIRPFAKVAIDGYLEEKYKTVLVIFPDFISPSVQKPKVETLLPFSNQNGSQETHLRQGSGGQAVTGFQYLIEPSPQVVLDSVLRNLVEMRIFQALLEGNASEHSARMIAMHSATENAKDLNSDLTLTYNQLRQESITREIAEISAGANA
ncbi:F0F1 ATP synthase subunit gamma, partial [bacterium]|nr:F0F1 ATP synthase subunit gamma [bacterium]